MNEQKASQWFAVRCLFRKGWPEPLGENRYEERITLWNASSAEDAISAAEEEAVEYANIIDESPDEYLKLAQCFEIEGEISSGVEIFSLLRKSGLDAASYMNRFFSTGNEMTR